MKYEALFGWGDYVEPILDQLGSVGSKDGHWESMIHDAYKDVG